MTNALARDVAISKDTQEPAQIQGSEKQTCEIDVPPVHHDEYSCSTDQVCVTDDYSSNKTSHDTVEPEDTNDNETLICEVYVPVMSVVDPSLLCAPNPESEGTTKSLESPGGDAAQPSLPPAAMAGMSEHEKPVPAVMPDGGDILAPTGSMGVCAVSHQWNAQVQLKHWSAMHAMIRRLHQARHKYRTARTLHLLHFRNFWSRRNLLLQQRCSLRELTQVMRVTLCKQTMERLDGPPHQKLMQRHPQLELWRCLQVTLCKQTIW